MTPEARMERISTVGIVGLGLIGTSIGLAIRQRRVADRVVGVDVDQAAVETAKSRGALDKGSTSYDVLNEAVLLVVAVPPRAVPDVAVSAARVMPAGGVLTDVGRTPYGRIGAAGSPSCGSRPADRAAVHRHAHCGQ
ncbi:MAG: prephenate dehydrogenase/arogenate dehydrogenase family protein [Armatimonadetes bacterium]|nr:prephenate dehydrogenase/arogenate dehydrogenase family protein [Armatimonadota bacterium]